MAANVVLEEKLNLTRPLDKHLDPDELDELLSLQRTSASDSEQPSESALREAQHHVESCQNCARTLQMQREISRMPTPGSAPPSSQCIGEAECLNIAAGLLPEATIRELMKHAAQCEHCGPLLKNAAETLVDEATPKEETWLAELPSARPEWKKGMAGMLRGAAESGDRAGAKDRRVNEREGQSRWRELFSWPRPVFAFAGVAVAVVAGWLGVRMLRPPSAEQLLAQAYAEHRTLEVRIPGAKYAPMRVERSASGSSLDKSPALLKAEALIGENLRKNPTDPAWLQAKARADLLDGNYESAIKSLQRALETKPENPALLTDLGSAYFVRAEAADRAIDYGNAIEAVGKALAKSPDDPVALFNRALACERMFLYTQAVDDWEHYLRIDPQGEWAEDARRHLSAIKQKLEQHEKSQNEPLLTPAQIAEARADDAAVREEIDGRVEEYLNVALMKWLPVSLHAKSARLGTLPPATETRAVRVLAELLSVRHNDGLLADLVNSRWSEQLGAAVDALSKAMAANAAGSPSDGLTASIEAEHFFRLASNRPGMLRAQMEELYALHRLFHSPECLRLAAIFENGLIDRHYSWMATQAPLEEFSCLDSQAKMDTGTRALTVALNNARSFHYPGLFLRGVGFAANLETDKGNLAGAAEWDRSGLSEYWSGRTGPMRAYQFYDDLSDQAQRSGRWHWAAVTGRDAVHAIASTANRSGEGIAHFQLSISLSMAAETEQAAEEYDIARTIFSGLPSNPGIRGFEGDAEVELAEAEAQRGLTDQAEARLLRAKADIPPDLDSYGTWLTYYRAQAQIASARRDEAAQERACLAVVGIGEAGLSTIHTEHDRLTWNHATSDCYGELTKQKLRHNEALAALSLWEWYLGAAVRAIPASPVAAFAAYEKHPPTLNVDAIEAQIPKLDRETVLVFAELDDQIYGWMYDDRGVYSEAIAIDRSKLARIAKDFAEECADPQADLTALRENGRALYGWLVAPFDSRFDPGRTLIVEATGSLASVPFQALVEPDGSYLGMHLAVASSPGIDYMFRLRHSAPISSNLSALVVGASATLGDEDQSPLPDAEREAEKIGRFFKNSVVLQGKQATQSAILSQVTHAAIFHFAGHAISSEEAAGLEVAPDSQPTSVARRILLSPDTIATAHLHNLELVVLSACSTGRAGEEGLADPAGITGAFLRAGVPHVVASRWNVDSTTTSALMTSMYQHLLHGESVPAALKDVYEEFSGNPATSHPYYWAAFNAFGRG